MSLVEQKGMQKVLDPFLFDNLDLGRQLISSNVCRLGPEFSCRVRIHAYWT
jgi:hypothetical protein